MTTSGREIITSQSDRLDRIGSVASSRIFTTEATTKADAIAVLATLGVYANPTTGQPNPGQAHPNIAGVFLDSLSYSPTADGTYRVDAQYSSVGLYVLEQVDKQKTNVYFRWNWGTYDYTIDFPYAVRVTRTNPGSTVSANIWVGMRQTVPKTDILLDIELRVPKVSLTNVSDIAKQTNTLHKFSANQSRTWLFCGATIRNVTDGEDLVTYQWRGESGDIKYEPTISDAAAQAGSTKDTKLYNGVKDSQNNYTLLYPSVARGQHEAWNLTPNASGLATDPPVFTSVAKYGIGDPAALPFLAAFGNIYQ